MLRPAEVVSEAQRNASLETPALRFIGDVTGVLPFTHVAEHQARIVYADMRDYIATRRRDGAIRLESSPIG